MTQLDPVPSHVDLVKEDPNSDSIWKIWLNNLYELVKELVAEEVQKGAFGEQAVSMLEPQVQADFSYNINADIWHNHSNNGTATVDSHRMKLSTGAAANQSANILSRVAIKYNAGQGGLFRATGVFTTGVANSTQLLGIGDVGDGYFFGYDGADFGILRRIGGHQEVQVLTVTTASSDAEDITITLDGVADATVTVTASGVISTTANEIASHDYSALGTGWEAHSPGNGTVVFVSYDAAAHAGSYTLSGATSAVGAFAQSIAGLAPTDTWVKQTDWNISTLIGTGSGMTLDTTKGNVYQIKYQWLGYGMVRFYVENDTDGKLDLVHEIRYANTSALPSVNNPTLPICYMVANGSNTSDIILYSGSCMGASEGSQNSSAHLHHGAGVLKTTGISTTELPILTIHNPVIWQSVPNRKRLKITASSVSVDGAKPAVIRLRLNPQLIAASYSDVETDVSTVEFDTAATGFGSSLGDQLYIDGLTKVDRAGFPIDDDFHLNPGETLTVSVLGVGGTTGANGITGSINWEEEY